MYYITTMGSCQEANWHFDQYPMTPAIVSLWKYRDQETDDNYLDFGRY